MKEGNLYDEKIILKLDKNEYGVIFHSLKDKRNQMKRRNEQTEKVDDMLLKLIELRKDLNELGEEEKQKGRKCHEAR